MPVTISRREALAQVRAMVDSGTCPMCSISGAAPVLAESPSAYVTFNRFPVRWGNLLVVTRRHAVSFSELSDSEHAEASSLCLRAARALEHVLAPARVFVASLGSARDDLPMTCPHLHWHVVPVGNGERPRDVLTWRHGVLEGSREEWQTLESQLRATLTAAAP